MPNFNPQTQPAEIPSTPLQPPTPQANGAPQPTPQIQNAAAAQAQPPAQAPPAGSLFKNLSHAFTVLY